MSELHEHPADQHQESTADPMRDLMMNALSEYNENPDLACLIIAYFHELNSASTK